MRRSVQLYGAAVVSQRLLQLAHGVQHEPAFQEDRGVLGREALGGVKGLEAQVVLA